MAGEKDSGERRNLTHRIDTPRSPLGPVDLHLATTEPTILAVVRQSLCYRDAVKLLGKDGRLVELVDKISSGAVLAAGLPQLLGVRAELIKLGRGVLDGLQERAHGLKRMDRTHRLEAAHGILVLTAFLEGLADTKLPFNVDELELTTDDLMQVSGLDDEKPLQGLGVVAESLFDADLPLPSPTNPYERVVSDLHDRYRAMAMALVGFVRNLHVWDLLNETKQSQFAEAMGTWVPDRAVRRYELLYRRLAVDCPEFFVWANLQDHTATRYQLNLLSAENAARLNELSQIFNAQHAAITGLSSFLRMVAANGPTSDFRRQLARAHAAALGRPIAEAGDLPSGMVMPTLQDAYVTPLFRVADVHKADPSRDSWWEIRELRRDASAFLAAHFTSSQATSAPLVVLGQPGSGKSVLTRILAALLPSDDFLTIRVALREVPAELDLQDQIEHAIRLATGERLEWRAFTRLSGDAVPVVLLDGFDELLQATGINRSDYLLRIQKFQQREADQGFPVAVLVTTRTAVANRARFPEDTVVLRLEPFGRMQIERWLRVWNEANRGYFHSSGLRALGTDSVLRAPALAGQPLLLLMLALYDAADNELQRLDGELVKADLYERLLARFARREVLKSGGALPDAAAQREVELELHRLAVVAFAMFNRGAQWVDEAGLNNDLAALRVPAAEVNPASMQAPLTAAQMVVGRFFFIHEVRATRAGEVLHTYEFLHATFGEYLVARMVARELRRLVAMEKAGTTYAAVQPDDSQLHALLSFVPLTERAAVAGFLSQLLVGWTDWSACRDLVLRLFRTSGMPRTSQVHSLYEPRPAPVARRIAAYGANLVLLAAVLGDGVQASELFPDGDPVHSWHQQALLWRSQFSPEEWTSFVYTYDVWRTDERDVIVALSERHADPPRVRLGWAGDTPDILDVQRQNFFLCGPAEDLVNHVLEPLVDNAMPAFRSWTDSPAGPELDVRALLAFWLSQVGGVRVDHRSAAYEAFIRAGPNRDTDGRLVWGMLLQAMLYDQSVPAELLLLAAVAYPQAPFAVDCVIRALGADGVDSKHALRLLDMTLSFVDISLTRVQALVLSAWVRVVELDLLHEAVPLVGLFHQSVELLNRDIDLSKIWRYEPELVRRVQWATSYLEITNQITWPDAFVLPDEEARRAGDEADDAL